MSEIAILRGVDNSGLRAVIWLDIKAGPLYVLTGELTEVCARAVAIMERRYFGGAAQRIRTQMRMIRGTVHVGLAVMSTRELWEMHGVRPWW